MWNTENIKKFNEIDSLKIKEDCLRIQEKDISDQVKNIDNENNKSWLIIWFVSAMITLWLTDLDLNLYYWICLFIFWLSPIIISLVNIWSKSVWYHININNYFVNNNDNYEQYLKDMHLTYQGTYYNVSKLLEKKAFLTKLSYIFTIIFIIYVLFIKLF